MTGTCNICKGPLNIEDDESTRDCGGDCLRCMAEIGEDPGCIQSMVKAGFTIKRDGTEFPKPETPGSLAERLIGTCESLDPSEVLGDDEKLLEEFDGLAFRCAGCGWWHGIEDLSDQEGDGELYCVECRPLEEDL